MLPLRSMTIPNETGASSRAKDWISRASESSKTLKCAGCRSVRLLPLRSVTVTGTSTRRESVESEY